VEEEEYAFAEGRSQYPYWHGRADSDAIVEATDISLLGGLSDSPDSDQKLLAMVDLGDGPKECKRAVSQVYNLFEYANNQESENLHIVPNHIIIYKPCLLPIYDVLIIHS
jgi:hypothetical protein